MLRLIYDTLFIIMMSLLTFGQTKTDILFALATLMPAVVSEIFLYHFSVKHGNLRAEKIRYRLIRNQIKTEEENRAMFSTDDEEERNVLHHDDFEDDFNSESDSEYEQHLKPTKNILEELTTSMQQRVQK